MNRTMATLGTMLAGAALLAACERTADGPDAKICQPFGAVAAAGTPGAESGQVDDCLHRQAYRLAGAHDPADVVAQATVAACADGLVRWNSATLGQAGEPTRGEPMDLVSGQPVTPLQQRYQFVQSRALYYVVQSRSGRCPIP